MMNNNKLSGDPTALVLGIISLVLIFLGCCCGIFTIVSLTLSIAGLVTALKSLKEYAANYENYSVSSYKNMNAAKIIGIVGIALSGLVLLLQISFFIIGGQKFTRSFWDELRKNDRFKREFHINDTVENSEGDINVKLKRQRDSIYLDTIAKDTAAVKIKKI